MADVFDSLEQGATVRFAQQESGFVFGKAAQQGLVFGDGDHGGTPPARRIDDELGGHGGFSWAAGSGSRGGAAMAVQPRFDVGRRQPPAGRGVRSRQLAVAQPLAHGLHVHLQDFRHLLRRVGFHGRGWFVGGKTTKIRQRETMSSIVKKFTTSRPIVNFPTEGQTASGLSADWGSAGYV